METNYKSNERTDPGFTPGKNERGKIDLKARSSDQYPPQAVLSNGSKTGSYPDDLAKYMAYSG